MVDDDDGMLQDDAGSALICSTKQWGHVVIGIFQHLLIQQHPGNMNERNRPENLVEGCEHAHQMRFSRTTDQKGLFEAIQKHDLTSFVSIYQSCFKQVSPMLIHWSYEAFPCKFWQHPSHINKISLLQPHVQLMLSHIFRLTMFSFYQCTRVRQCVVQAFKHILKCWSLHFLVSSTPAKTDMISMIYVDQVSSKYHLTSRKKRLNTSSVFFHSPLTSAAPHFLSAYPPQLFRLCDSVPWAIQVQLGLADENKQAIQWSGSYHKCPVTPSWLVGVKNIANVRVI